MQKRLSFQTQMLLSFSLSIIFGLVFQGNNAIVVRWIEPIGIIYLNAIKMLIIPIVVVSITYAACTLELQRIAKLSARAFIYFVISNMLAIVFALSISRLFNVGTKGLLGSQVVTYEANSVIDISELLVNILPSNIFKAFTDSNMQQIVIVSLIFGIGISSMRTNKITLVRLISALSELLSKLTRAIMIIAPIGIFGLLVPVVANSGLAVFVDLIGFIVAVYAGCIAWVLVLSAVTVLFFSKNGIKNYLMQIYPALMVSFTTSSSNATLPTSIKCAVEGLGLPMNIAGYVLTLGANIGKSGTVIYQTISIYLIARIYGIELGLTSIMSIVFFVTFFALGTAGVPSAGLVMLSSILISIGLPIEGVGLVASVERVVDMIRTVPNVAVSIACASFTGTERPAIEEKRG